MPGYSSGIVMNGIAEKIFGKFFCGCRILAMIYATSFKFLVGKK